MKKLLFFFLIFVYGKFVSQEVHQFPPMQDSYEGGKEQFYKDFHQVVIHQNLKPCENSKEHYNLKLVIYPDRSIKYVKDGDSINVEKNKCAFNLARTGVKYLKGWKPAIINGKETPAVASFWIAPDFLFDKYEEGYTPLKYSKNAEYKGGISKFRKDVIKNIDITRFSFTRKVEVQICFIVRTDGKISNIEFEQSSGLKEFDDMLVDSVKKTKQWIPATISGIPVNSHFRFPLSFNSQ